MTSELVECPHCGQDVANWLGRNGGPFERVKRERHDHPDSHFYVIVHTIRCNKCEGEFKVKVSYAQYDYSTDNPYWVVS